MVVGLKGDTMETIKPMRRSFLPIYTKGNSVFEYQTKDIGVSWLTDLMDDVRKAGQNPWREPRETIRSSSVGDQCVRSLSLTFLGWNSIFSSRTLRIFNQGKYIESGVLEELKDAGILVDDNTEVKFNLPIPLVGFYDAKIEHPETKEPIILEIKSINEGYFDKLPEPSDNPKENFNNLLPIQIGYLSQLTAYLQATGIHHGVLLYEAKNTQKRKAFKLEFNDAFFASIIARVTEAWEYAQKGEVAPRTRDIAKDVACVRCDKKELCSLLAKNGATREEAMRIDGKLRPNIEVIGGV